MAHRSAAASLQSDWRQCWRGKKLRLLKPLASRAVEKNRVRVGLPDCREGRRSGTVDAEKFSARLAAAEQDPFGQRKTVEFQLMLVT